MALKYDYYLFDFDGTVADTGEGIRKSVAYSLERMGFPPLDTATLSRFIGPPLHDSYVEFCGMSDDQAERAIELYRERYVDVGLYESRLYPGIAMLLRALRRAGAWVGIASAKPQFMLERLSKHFGIDKYLNAISGTGLGRHSADKQDLILAALPQGANVARACMTGDRRFDIEAAVALGMTGIGADYGYSAPGELAAAGADAVFDSVSDMALRLLDGEAPRGLFISLEGSDGCGKSTQIALLKAYLEKRGFETVLTREPGGCPISERIREVILSLDSKGMSDECEALLYAASRIEHVREVIEPALKCGKIVICDRFLDSSIAYQAYGRELGEAFIRQINAPAIRRALPDMTLLLQVDRAESRRRMAQGAPLDRLELEKEDFFARIQAGYEALAQAEPNRVTTIDASKSIEEVAEAVKAAVDGILD
ncbi:MAG: dTMP kinase [Clostridia bacterium]|nr:dTMP kinase [Clostridia bacterium]